MAKRTAEGDVKAGNKDAKPKKYSSKLMQMKFMQRGAKPSKAAGKEQAAAAVKEEGAQAEEPAAQPKLAQEDFKWVLDAREDREAGCCVILEGDPPPQALTGHMSFQSFNPAVEQLLAQRQQEAEEERHPGGKSVSDAEMAKRLKPSSSSDIFSKSRGSGGRYFAS